MAPLAPGPFQKPDWHISYDAIMARLKRARKSNIDHRRVSRSPAAVTREDGAAVAEAVQRSGRIRPVAPQAKGPGRVRGAVEGIGVSSSLLSFSPPAPAATAPLPSPLDRVPPAQPALGIEGATFPPQLRAKNEPPSRLKKRELHSGHRRRSKHERLSRDEREQRRRDRRRRKWQRRADLRTITTLRSVKACGVVPIPQVQPMVCRTEHADGSCTAGFGGLLHCGSVWACPVCSAKVAARRAEEIRAVLEWALEQGYSASMATFTLRHFKGQSLEQCWDALGAGWRASIQGKYWVADQARYGLVGWVKAVEGTYGKHGWHVHVHVLMIWDRDGKAVQADAQTVAEGMHARFTRALQRKGFDSWRDSGGLDVRMASLDPDANGLHEYFTKMAHEVTGGYAKLGRGKGRTPFQILDNAFETCLAEDFDLWFEWEQGSKGRRQLNWSVGLRAMAGLGQEQTDEEVAAEELTADERLILSYSTWKQLRHDPMACCDLLEVTETGGLEAAGKWLDERGMYWRRPGTGPPDDG